MRGYLKSREFLAAEAGRFHRGKVILIEVERSTAGWDKF